MKENKNNGTAVRKNSVHLLHIEDMTNLGSGVAHLDGMAVFVTGAVDGDTVEAKIIKCASGYCVARTERVVEPSPYRIESDCPCSRRCGGCVYRSVAYGHELELKRRQVVAAYRKAGIAISLERVEHAADTDRYRNKIQYPVENGRIGYYAAHSHEIVECADCRLQREEFTRPMETVRAFLSRHPGSPVRHIFMRCGKSGVTVCLVIGADSLPGADELVRELSRDCSEVSGILLNINKTDTNVILGEKFVLLQGEPYVYDELCSVEFRIAPAAFYQVNRGAAELLYRRALEYAAPKEGDRILDLYCGAGTIGLSFAAACPGIRVTGVEIVPEAVEDAKYNAAHNGITNAEFFVGDLGAAGADVGQTDTVVLDPPRKGCSDSLIRRLAELAAPKIVYVSCDVNTMARDVAKLLSAGYTLGRISAFDLFPRTGHVETVCCLYHQKNDFISVPYEPKDADYLKQLK